MRTKKNYSPELLNANGGGLIRIDLMKTTDLIMLTLEAN